MCILNLSMAIPASIPSVQNCSIPILELHHEMIDHVKYSKYICLSNMSVNLPTSVHAKESFIAKGFDGTVQPADTTNHELECDRTVTEHNH